MNVAPLAQLAPSTVDRAVVQGARGCFCDRQAEGPLPATSWEAASCRRGRRRRKIRSFSSAGQTLAVIRLMPHDAEFARRLCTSTSIVSSSPPYLDRVCSSRRFEERLPGCGFGGSAMERSRSRPSDRESGASSPPARARRSPRRDHGSVSKQIGRLDFLEAVGARPDSMLPQLREIVRTRPFDAPQLPGS